VEAEIEKDHKVTLEDTTVSSVGSAVGKSMLISSGLALLIGIGAILIYVTLRFEFAFALGAIAALFHDLIVVVGITTLLGQEVTLITVGAFLTIAGYSINDTIVVFDRVREGLATKRGDVKDIMNYSLNKTLARTLLTSATTLITVTVLYIFGGPGLRNFAETLIIGVIIGTYSSIFIASPIVLWWARKSGTNLRREVLDTEQSKVDALGGQQA
jgi:SecD/SecF fusion protein